MERRRMSPQTRLVLLALADQGREWGHGYDLCGRLGLKAGTMYPILIRLAERGLLETSWEQDG
ncbi:MAG TPA: PadR family transcriptional regulator, partial [Propionicimonas sp.]|nr:PadR family transcriptional regulator [Propionicimonas sp.]